MVVAELDIKDAVKEEHEVRAVKKKMHGSL
jgi:hypothetical protein